MKYRMAWLSVIASLLFASDLDAQSNAPKYQWTSVDTSNIGGKLSVKISFAPASVTVKNGNVNVWLLTEQYRAADDYREKYYGEYAIDCRNGNAREISSVMDRFGRGKPPRYGQKKTGFNDYPNVLDANNRGEARVLGNLARKRCTK